MIWDSQSLAQSLEGYCGTCFQPESASVTLKLDTKCSAFAEWLWRESKSRRGIKVGSSHYIL